MIGIALVVVGLASAAFGWWGTYTLDGRHAYDEMAGIVPFFALWGGLLLVLIGAGIKYLNFRRS